ncbi:MAG: hypothetical protein HC923_00285 [Myxococcales bacterium]|nr:hypothetical protein [Myxococcales bacterium]
MAEQKFPRPEWFDFDEKSWDAKQRSFAEKYYSRDLLDAQHFLEGVVLHDPQDYEPDPERGYPIQCNEALEEDILKLVRRGLSKVQIARVLGIPYESIGKWQRRDPVFAAALEDAGVDRSEYLEAWAQHIADSVPPVKDLVAKARLQVDTLKWRIMKLHGTPHKPKEDPRQQIVDAGGIQALLVIPDKKHEIVSGLRTMLLKDGKLTPERLDTGNRMPTTIEGGTPPVESVLFSPTAPQAAFLASDAFELLGGGSRGGGKTLALIYDAMGLRQKNGPAITNPHYKAIILRTSREHFQEVVARCGEIYPAIVPGTTFNRGRHTYQFPSGASVRLSFLKSEHDANQYQGHEYHYVGWEELTHWSTDAGYEMMLATVRGARKAGVTPYVRATTNPGGLGHDWVQARWQIPDTGGPTKFQVKVPVFIKGQDMGVRSWVREFIPMDIRTNPHLEDEYLAQLASMDDEDLKRHWLEGTWGRANIKGLIYAEHISAAYNHGRINSLPVLASAPVHTFWDFGASDKTAIWFMQHDGAWLNFIEYYENSQQGLDHYVSVLNQVQARLGFTLWGTHYLPHDAKHQRLQVDRPKSIQEMLFDLGLHQTRIVSSIRVPEGIELTRLMFPRCRFDADRCEKGITALNNYRYAWDDRAQMFSSKPLSNWATHGADAFRMCAVSYRDSADPEYMIKMAAQRTRWRDAMENRRGGLPLLSPKRNLL